MTCVHPGWTRRTLATRALALLALCAITTFSTAALADDNPIIPPGHGEHLLGLVGADALPSGLTLESAQVHADHARLIFTGPYGHLSLRLLHPSQDEGHRTQHFAIQVDASADWPGDELADTVRVLVERIDQNDTVDVWRAPAKGQPIETQFGSERVPPGPAVVAAVLLALIVIALAIGTRRRGLRHALWDPSTTPDPAARWEWWTVGFLTAATIAVACAAVWIRYHHLSSDTWDFGIYSQAFWHASQGNGFYNSIEGIDHLGSHASPVLYILLPVYLLWPSPVVLPLLNALAVASCVLPGWLIARRRLEARPALTAALVLALVPVMTTLVYEIHAVKFAAPCLLWAVWAIDARRSVAYLMFLLLALSCKENVGMVVVFLGVYLATTRGTRFAGLVSVALGVAWLLVGIKLIIPMHGGDLSRHTMVQYDHLANGWLPLLLSPLTAPGAFWPHLLSTDTLAYVAMLLVPFGLVPLLGGRALLIPLPIVLQNLLAHDEAMRSLTMHYEALVLPGMFLAFVVGLQRLLGWIQGRPRLVLAIAGLACALLSHSLSGQPLVSTPPSPAEVRARQAVLDNVPERVSVAAPADLLPYLCQRPVCQPLRLWSEREPPEVVVLEKNAPNPELPPSAEAWLRSYETTFENNFYILYRRAQNTGQ